MAMNEMANSIGVLIWIEPLTIVAIQLRILTPVGIAIAIVDIANAEVAAGPRPTVNMWCDHTNQPRKAMEIPENMTNGYPNRGFRENVGMISETIPMAGRIRM